MEQITMDRVAVLNSTSEVINHVDWRRAVTLVVNGKASVHTSVPGKLIRSKDWFEEAPRVIQLFKYVYLDHNLNQMFEIPCNKKNILRRDRHTCGYCGEYGDTIDHILPQAHGGITNWFNVVTACVDCNGKKRDRTPQEAGMRLLVEPYTPRERKYKAM